MFQTLPESLHRRHPDVLRYHQRDEGSPREFVCPWEILRSARPSLKPGSAGDGFAQDCPERN